jgi:hypothetical protein
LLAWILSAKILPEQYPDESIVLDIQNGGFGGMGFGL